MKGVTRVTASLLAAAMTAGLGTTAVFAEGSNVADPGADDTSVDTSWIEVFDNANRLLASTDPEDEQVYDYHDTNKSSDYIDNVNKHATSITGATTLEIDLPVGSSKTLSLKLDDDSAKVNTAKFSYEDKTKDGVINNKDTVTAKKADGTSASTPEQDVVALDNGTFTAKLAGDVTFYAYASDAVKKDSTTDATVKGTHLDGYAKYVVINVHAYYPTKGDYTIQYKNRDTVYLDTEVTAQNAEKYDASYEASQKKDVKFTNALPKATEKNVKHLYYHGSQFVAHAAEGDALEFTTTLREGLYDDSDTGSTVVKYGTTTPKYLSVSGDVTGGTVNVSGTAPTAGLGRVVAYLDKNDNGRYDKGEELSNALLVVGNTGVEVYRVYNPNSGEHFYTTDKDEKNGLIDLGWQDEGVGWYAPEKSATPVYRLYNANGSEHIYTTDSKEVDMLVKAGWSNEGVRFYSASSKYYPLYRQLNPNAFSNNHNYTSSVLERTFLVSVGWKDEGAKLYATQISKDTLAAAAKYVNDNSSVNPND